MARQNVIKISEAKAAVGKLPKKYKSTVQTAADDYKNLAILHAMAVDGDLQATREWLDLILDQFLDFSLTTKLPERVVTTIRIIGVNSREAQKYIDGYVAAAMDLKGPRAITSDEFYFGGVHFRRVKATAKPKKVRRAR